MAKLIRIVVVMNKAEGLIFERQKEFLKKTKKTRLPVLWKKDCRPCRFLFIHFCYTYVFRIIKQMLVSKIARVNATNIRQIILITNVGKVIKNNMDLSKKIPSRCILNQLLLPIFFHCQMLPASGAYFI